MTIFNNEAWCPICGRNYATGASTCAVCDPILAEGIQVEQALASMFAKELGTTGVEWTLEKHRQALTPPAHLPD